MIRKFLRILSKKTDKPVKKSYLENLIDNGSVRIGSRSITSNINVQIRSNIIEKTLLQIGDDSVVNGSFIFENSSGRIIIGDRSFIGGGKFISIKHIEIGNDVLISWGCTVMDNDAHSLQWDERRNDVLDWKRGLEENNIGVYKNWEHVESRPIVIKDKSWIGFECAILKGVTIGTGAVVGSRSVVTKDVPDYAVVAGNPAKIVKYVNQ